MGAGGWGTRHRHQVSLSAPHRPSALQGTQSLGQLTETQLQFHSHRQGPTDFPEAVSRCGPADVAVWSRLHPLLAWTNEEKQLSPRFLICKLNMPLLTEQGVMRTKRANVS